MRGISLIEVLASIFIVSVGLLGVLAVIPFGAFQVSEANHAGYASNMLLNAVEEIALRKLAQPETWNVGEIISGTGANKETVYKRGTTFSPTESTLNCTRILWVETRGMRDIPPHIFTIGSTFEPKEKWSELMRGQDDLVQTMNEESDRPQLVLNENGKPMSSGKYEWCFTYKPKTTAVSQAQEVARFLTSSIKIELNRKITVEETVTKPDPNDPDNTIEVVETNDYPALIEIPADNTDVRATMYSEIEKQKYSTNSPFALNGTNLKYLIDIAVPFAKTGKILYLNTDDNKLYYAADSVPLVEPDDTNTLTTRLTNLFKGAPVIGSAPVDVIACYQRAPDEDMLAIPADFDITYSPASRSGTITFHDPKFLQALENTKYVFLTWGGADYADGGTWCRIVFLAKGEQPKIIITGDLASISTNNLHVYIPSGAVYHKHIENMPIWEH